MRWQSELRDCGSVILPPFAGIRVLMMPFQLANPRGTLPAEMHAWVPVVEQMRDLSPCRDGVAYLTIDERDVPAGACHRRPGLHVDGWRDDIGAGMWGGSCWAGGFDGHGMMMAASHIGAAAYVQEFDGQPMAFGDCEHLRPACRSDARRVLESGRLYWCGPLTVHESIAATDPIRRQFVRLSLPSNGSWPVSCTPNPLGIESPQGVCGPRPEAFTQYMPIGSVSTADLI